LGSEKYIRPLLPATIATGPQLDASVVNTSCAVGSAEVASNHTSLSSPVTVTQTRPPGPTANEVGESPTG
jgi:hypothetical protein